jgi:hypothetical protein
MKKHTFIFLIFAFVSPIMAGELPLSPVCWPLNFAGITLGVTTDSEVQRLLGNGVFRSNDGSVGERYFVDSGHTATLHTVNYTDTIVGEVTLQEGIDVKPTEISEATSQWFNPRRGFGNWHALHLGSTKEDVKSNLGESAKGKSTNAWRYDSKCACDIEIYFTVYFKNDRIWKVVFSAPAG